MPTARPVQTSLFAATEPGPLVRVNSTSASLSRSQRTFNQLTGQIRRTREELLRWEDSLVLYRERHVKALHPVLQRVRTAQRQLLDCADQLLGAEARGERLGRRHRLRLESMLVSVIEDLLSDPAIGQEPDLVAMHARYAGTQGGSTAHAQLQAAEILMGSVFGADAVAGHAAEDLESLFEHVQARMSEREEVAEQTRAQAAAARRAKRGGPSKAQLARERKAAAAIEASGSVRDIYRKLVSSLHPDREPDAAERERKTSLLQRANQAYERGDLLALFGLQLEIEQIDADHLAGVPEARMKHYVAMLREQLVALQQRLAQVYREFQIEFDLPGPNVAPAWAERAIRRQVKEAKALLQQIEQDLVLLKDPRRRGGLLDSLPDPQPEDFDAIEMEMLSVLFSTLPSAPPPGRGKSRRRRSAT
jgi:predicted DNA-binding protein YlxM (UPF0122 family)